MTTGFRAYAYLTRDEKKWLVKKAAEFEGESCVLRALIIEKMRSRAPWDPVEVILKKELRSKK